MLPCLLCSSKLTTRGRTDVVSDLADEGLWLPVNQELLNVRHLTWMCRYTVCLQSLANRVLQDVHCNQTLTDHEKEAHWKGPTPHAIAPSVADTLFV